MLEQPRCGSTEVEAGGTRRRIEEACGIWKQEEWEEARKKRMEGKGGKNKAKQRGSGW